MNIKIGGGILFLKSRQLKNDPFSSDWHYKLPVLILFSMQNLQWFLPSKGAISTKMDIVELSQVLIPQIFFFLASVISEISQRLMKSILKLEIKLNLLGYQCKLYRMEKKGLNRAWPRIEIWLHGFRFALK